MDCSLMLASVFLLSLGVRYSAKKDVGKRAGKNFQEKNVHIILGVGDGS